jgi:hypothetical protein
VLEGVRREIGRIDGTVRALVERARPRALQVAVLSRWDMNRAVATDGARSA